MGVIVFDIETAPLPEARLRQLCPPFDPADVKIDPAVLLPFDPDSVKYGLMKDEAKKKEKLEDCRKKHVEEQAKARVKLESAKEEHWAAFVAKAALSARTAQVAAIGYLDSRRSPPIMLAGVEHGDSAREASVIRKFWSLVTRSMSSRGDTIVGHNILGFDLPFLIRRSWILGITPPSGLMDKYRHWHPIFQDTMVIWGCGIYGDRSGLGNLAKALEVGQKPDDCDGAGFHKLYYSGNPEQRAIAEQYLRNDLEMTAGVAFRLGVA